LGVLFVDSNEGSVMVQNGLESSLILNVEAKKDLDPVMIDLKKLFSEKSIEAFFHGGR